MKRSADFGERTFYPPQENIFPLSRHMCAYHPGRWMNANPFKILVVSGSEAAFLKRDAIPVSELTDTEIQLKRSRRVANLTHIGGIRRLRAELVGFVQDTPGARSTLNAGKFKEQSPRLDVYEDPVAIANF